MPTHLSPAIPDLDDLFDADRLALRRAHLVAEIAAPARHLTQPARRLPALSRTKRRVGYGVGFTGTAGAAAAALVLLSGGASPAFASWTAEPTPTAPSLLDCPQASDSGGTPVLAEKRGDYTLTVVADGSSMTTCLSGDGLQVGSASASATDDVPAAGTVTLGPSSADGKGTASGAITGSATATGSAATTGGGPAAGTAPTSMTASPGEMVLSTKDGGVSVVNGRVGSGVSDVQVVRSDGTTVDATVKGTWFAAWWPGEATATKVTWKTADGATHSLDVPKAPALPAVPPGAVTQVNPGTSNGPQTFTASASVTSP